MVWRKADEEDPVIVPPESTYGDQLTQLVISRQTWIINTLLEHGIKVLGMTVTWKDDQHYHMEYHTQQVKPAGEQAH